MRFFKKVFLWREKYNRRNEKIQMDWLMPTMSCGGKLNMTYFLDFLLDSKTVAPVKSRAFPHPFKNSFKIL